MSLSTVRRALGRVATTAKKTTAKAAEKSREKARDDDDGEAPGIDWSAAPLDLARALLRSATKAITELPPDSPRLNPARTEARNLTRLISRLEQEHAAKDTPEEIERRRRREDGETRRKIEQYVKQALDAALQPTTEAPCGRCPTCAAALTPDVRAAILGTPP